MEAGLVEGKNEFSRGTFNVISYSSMESCKTMFVSHVYHTSTVKIVFPVEFVLANPKRKPIIEQEKRIDDLSGGGKKAKKIFFKNTWNILAFYFIYFFAFKRLPPWQKKSIS